MEQQTQIPSYPTITSIAAHPPVPPARVVEPGRTHAISEVLSAEAQQPHFVEMVYRHSATEPDPPPGLSPADAEITILRSRASIGGIKSAHFQKGSPRNHQIG
jgi:hypothetical protein